MNRTSVQKANNVREGMEVGSRVVVHYGDFGVFPAVVTKLADAAVEVKGEGGCMEKVPWGDASEHISVLMGGRGDSGGNCDDDGPHKSCLIPLSPPLPLPSPTKLDSCRLTEAMVFSCCLFYTP